MLKSIHLVGASLEVGEHHYHYVSSGLCCNSIMFSKQLSCVLSNPQNHHFTFFVTLQIHLHLPFCFVFYVRCFSRLMHKKFFPFVFKLLKIKLQFSLVLVFPRSRLLALLPGLFSPLVETSNFLSKRRGDNYQANSGKSIINSPQRQFVSKMTIKNLSPYIDVKPKKMKRWCIFYTPVFKWV